MIKRLFVFVFTLAFTTSLFAQNIKFTPKWKVGTTKKVTIKQTEKEYQGDILLEDTTKYNDATIKVLSETENSYTLELVYENQALTQVIELYDKMDTDLREYSDITLIYEVDKGTGSKELKTGRRYRPLWTIV